MAQLLARLRPDHRPSPSARRAVIVLTSALVAALSLTLLPATAATTVSPAEPGTPPVVRGDAVNLSVDTTAFNYTRTTASGSFAAQTALATSLGAGCRGDNPAGTNNSARTVLTVQDPDGTTILTETSPVRNLSTAGFFTSPPNQPTSPQPAPGNSNYRGDFPGNTFHGMKANLSLAGKPGGVYTVTTTNNHTIKTGAGACAIGRPGSPATTFITGPEVITTTFEYRPWQHSFKDILGKGRVSLNSDPGEYTFSIGSKSSPIYAAGAGNQMKFYSLPDATGFALPTDPEACVTDPSSCLPAVATTCNPAAGCSPRLAFVSRPQADGKHLFGVFDLETGAFIASAEVDGTKRVLMSLGAENDTIYDDVIAKLSDGAAAQGIDLPSILATEVRVNGGDGQQTTLSLLNGLQVDPSESHGGVQIASNATAQAGIVLHIYSSLRLDGGACANNSASSSTDPNRFTPNEDNGYTVTKSDVLPRVPEVGALGAIVGGPLYHITGTFKSDALVNTASAVIGVDTASDEPNGYPVWIEPFISSPAHVATPKKMDFLGTGTWSASEAPVLSGCLVVDFLLGTGVALFNNPLPVGLGTIFDPLAKPTPAAEQLTDKVSEVLDEVTGQITGNPTVSSLLQQLIDALPLA